MTYSLKGTSRQQNYARSMSGGSMAGLCRSPLLPRAPPPLPCAVLRQAGRCHRKRGILGPPTIRCSLLPRCPPQTARLEPGTRFKNGTDVGAVTGVEPLVPTARPGPVRASCLAKTPTRDVAGILQDSFLKQAATSLPWSTLKTSPWAATEPPGPGPSLAPMGGRLYLKGAA